MPDIIGVYKPEEIEKAVQLANIHQGYKNPTDPKTAFIDPTSVMNYLGTKAKPSPIGYAVLRAMALRAKPVAAIIQTRLNQVARFAKRPIYQGDTGFRITTKDPDHEPTEAEKKRARQIEDAFLSTGFIRNRKRKDNFDTFLRKIVRDSLTLDAMSIELVPDRKGDLAEWWAVDGATVEVVVDMAIPNSEMTVYEPITEKGRQIRGEIAYVQRVFGEILAEYTEEELAYGIRNPRTDVDYNLFGLSELEVLVETVTHILNAESYNGSYFTNNNLPQGVLEIVGKYEDEHLEGFKRAWESLISGAVGKWKVPIMAMEEGQGLKFTPFKQSSRDMEYHAWLEFLTSLACAVYQIDPSEIGMKPWSAGRQSMFQSDSEEARVDASKSKGFYPLMQFLANTFNSEIVDRIDANFKFEWTGLNEEDQAAKEKQRNERLASGFTVVAEERAAEDKDPIEKVMTKSGLFQPEEIKQIASWAYLPANQVLMGAVTTYMQSQAQAQQQQGQQQFQGAQSDADRQHQLQLLEKQHLQSLEAQGYSHEQAVEMAKQAAATDMQKMDKQHGQSLEQAGMQGEQQMDQAKMQNSFQAGEADKQHGRGLEQAAMQGEIQGQQAQQQNKFQAGEAEKQHGRGLEQTAMQGEQAQAQAKGTQKFQAGEAEKQHNRSLEQASMAQEGAGKEPKPKKPRQKLNKSINTNNDTITIEIEL